MRTRVNSFSRYLQPRQRDRSTNGEGFGKLRDGKRGLPVPRTLDRSRETVPLVSRAFFNIVSRFLSEPRSVSVLMAGAGRKTVPHGGVARRRRVLAVVLRTLQTLMPMLWLFADDVPPPLSSRPSPQITPTANPFARCAEPRRSKRRDKIVLEHSSEPSSSSASTPSDDWCSPLLHRAPPFWWPLGPRDLPYLTPSPLSLPHHDLKRPAPAVDCRAEMFLPRPLRRVVLRMQSIRAGTSLLHAFGSPNPSFPVSLKNRY